MIASDADPLARIVVAQFRRRLLDEQLPRLRRCAELLGDARIWQRPHRHGNSVGNLLLHLAGNTTQWILATFGAIDDRRERAAEFAAEGGRSAADLLELLERTYVRAVAVVEGLPVAELLRPRLVQGYQETGLSAVLHVLEHGAGHAYQIYAATKQALDVDLRFYDL